MGEAGEKERSTLVVKKLFSFVRRSRDGLSLFFKGRSGGGVRDGSDAGGGGALAAKKFPLSFGSIREPSHSSNKCHYVLA